MKPAMSFQFVLTAALAASSLSLIACGGPQAKKALVASKIQGAIQFSAEAKTAGELETSESGPRAVMMWAKKTNDPQIAQPVCESLLELDAEKLVAFEKDIRSGEFNEVFEKCEDRVFPTGELISKLEQYWADQRLVMAESGMATQSDLDYRLDDKVFSPGQETPPSSSSSKFITRIQKTDYSKADRDNYFVTGGVKRKELVLTFDDGPAQDTTPLVLNALKRMDAKSMFFMLGAHAEKHPRLVNAVAENGHMIGSHSYSHPKLGPNPPRKGVLDTDYKKTPEAISEITRGHQAIMGVLGWIDPIFRFPYGNKTATVARFVKENEMGEFFWAFDSRDWSSRTKHPAVCPEAVENKKASCANTPMRLLKAALHDLDNTKDSSGNPLQRGIVLFHDVQRRTAEMLPEFLHEIRARGYNLVLMPSVDDNARFNSKLKPGVRP